MYKWLIVFGMMGPSAWAGNLTAPYDLDSAGVLPRGVRSPRFKSIFLNMESKFNGQGVAQPLGASLNKVITFGDLVKSQPSAKDRALAEGTIRSAGFGLTDSAGQTTGQINTYVDVKVPVLSYGLTSKTTLALVVPIYDIQVDADTGYVANAAAQVWSKGVYNSSPEKAVDIETRMADPANASLKSKGYHEIRDERTRGIGDVKFVSKTQIWKSEFQIVALKGTVTAPTGTAPNADKVVDTATGDGQWDVGVRGVFEQKMTADLGLGFFAGYNAQLPDQLDRRIPEERGNQLSSDKESVFRDSGDQVDAGVQITAGSASGGLSVGLGYSYQYMMPTHFQGEKFNGQRYRWLEEFYPEQDIHAVTLGAAYSTIDDFRAKKFPLPLQASFYVSHPLSGRSSATSEVFSGEFVMFF